VIRATQTRSYRVLRRRERGFAARIPGRAVVGYHIDGEKRLGAGSASSMVPQETRFRVWWVSTRCLHAASLLQSVFARCACRGWRLVWSVASDDCCARNSCEQRHCVVICSHCSVPCSFQCLSYGRLIAILSLLTGVCSHILPRSSSMTPDMPIPN
jgi:hypothetical protein